MMVCKQHLISTPLINPFGTSVIDQHIRESIKLIGFYHRVTAFQLCSFQLPVDFKGHAVAIMEFPD